MELTTQFGGERRMASVRVSGDLDISAAATFNQLIMGLHEILGPDASYDLSDVVVRDAAGRSALEMLAHEFREYGPALTLPVGTPSPTALP